jgi:RNase H-like domain found in reverse transcriptase
LAFILSLGSVISQEGHPIAFYSRKRTETQCNYTVGEREVHSIVETMQPIDKSTEEFEQVFLFAQDPLTTDAERIQNIVENITKKIKLINKGSLVD